MKDLSLRGLRVVVTRAVHQAEELAIPLRELGAEAILLPLIEIGPPARPDLLEKAIGEIDSYDWIVFTSANGVRALGKQQCRARVATVGAATRELAQDYGWTVRLTPEAYVAESLGAAFEAVDLRGKKVLIPSAAVTRDVVREALQHRGAMVDLVEAYRNRIPARAAEMAQQVFQLPFPDWITFASSSAVENLLSLTPAETIQSSKIASIGPVTSRTLHQGGLAVEAEAKEHTIEGLVEGIVQAVLSSKS